MERIARITALAAVLAANPAACAHHGPRSAQRPGLAIPIMPLAQGHIPPVWTPAPTAALDDSIPMRISGVSRHGESLRVVWDAPGATLAVVSFSADGTRFHPIARTGDPAAEFVLPAPHGIVRVYVTDGNRRNTADYRI